ncbi:MAG: DUF3488 and transglutaminase-like domain-containing protein [Pseudomonadota bacterium]
MSSEAAAGLIGRANGIGQAVHRGTLLWLLLCQTLVMLPFLDSHPVWLVGLFGVCLAWRGWALRHGVLSLHRYIKALAVIVGLFALIASGYRHYDIDSMVAIVLLGFALKSIETWRYRDTHMIVFTGMFLCAAHFIYAQSPWQALYTMVAVASLLACANSIYRAPEAQTRTRFLGPLKVSGGMMALAIPLALLLFFIVPRIPPLWAIPQQQRATTGLSDSVTPGDIASLVQSGEDAFRVRFYGDMPPREQWYWRALVFDEFDGRTWSVKEAPPVVPVPPAFKAQSDYRYDMFVKASGQPWLAVLDTPTNFSAQTMRYTQYRTLEALEAIHSVSRFTVSSNSQLRRYFVPGTDERLSALQLPESGNPELREWARQAFARSASPGEFVNDVLRHIREREYFYTLAPGVVRSVDSLDAFWFDTREGFCSHYASAFVFIMRSVGIPARMVGGYLGGRLNSDEGFITVRQMDAHAWAEVWLPGSGWVRVDPTSAVAPDRVLADLSDVFADSPEFISSLAGRTYDFLPLRRLQLWLDVFEFQWHRAVVQFGENERAGLLDRLFGRNNPIWSSLATVAALAAALLLWWGLFALRAASKHSSPQFRLLAQLERKLAKQDLHRRAGETVADFLQRSTIALPSAADKLAHIAQLFNRLEYARDPTAEQRQTRSGLRAAIRSLTLH